MRKKTTCYRCDKPIEAEWLPEGEVIICDECLSETDELSVENLQEQLNTAKKALTEEIESIEEYLDKYGMSSYGANTRQAYLEGLKKALAVIGGDDEN
ncbi:MAG: hypothetical protein [Caudoviricetes sp.]|nr:MAG: hypothetical protein [Caudoviricetes sp.]